MKFGIFDDSAREYVITQADTPRPWSNYLGSTEYGAIITNHAGGYSFFRSALGSRFLRLRPNSVPLDQPGRYFYLRDNETGDYFSASWQPVGKSLDRYRTTCRHGTAYTIIASEYSGITTETTYFVPLGQTFEYWRLRVGNSSARRRSLSVFTYCEFATSWHMPSDMSNLQYSQFIAKATVQNEILEISIHPYVDFDPNNLEGCGRVWMTLRGAPLIGFETVRENFLGGAYSSYASPLAVARGYCTDFLAEGENPCGTLQVNIDLEPGETRELIVMLGLGTAESHGRDAIAEFGHSDRCKLELARLKAKWHSQLESISVTTPDQAFDSMVNVWNAYNALITYAWSRHASLIYNGERDGLGFRDTVQDFLGVTHLLGEAIQPRIELMLSGQVSSGGAIAVVKPETHNPGHETAPSAEDYRSDDCLWFFNAIPDFVAETGNLEFYRKSIPFADKGHATVLGHLRRALEFNLQRTGKNGLPCGLAADWNDCVRMGYEGESVMVTFQVRYGLATYADISRRLGLTSEAQWALERLQALDRCIQNATWDGEWFLWAIGADGHRYGSHRETEGQIYVNTQSWAVISGSATPEQAHSAMQAVATRIATPFGIMLSSPPFTKTPRAVMGGVIYNHGIKENAGIFCHTQGWAVMAEAMLGHGDLAYQYYRAYMPAAYNDRASEREIEPYVHCQTVYAPCNRNAGKARVPWLTGAAAWSLHAAIQWILGIRPELDGLRIDPCIPSGWPGFTMQRVFRGMRLQIEVTNPRSHCKGVSSLTIDGKTVSGNLAPLERLRDGCKISAALD